MVASGTPDPLTGYAVHFTRGATDEQIERLGPPPPGGGDFMSFHELNRWYQARDRTGYTNSISILYSRSIWPARPAYNVAVDIPEVADVVNGACLSTTRLDALECLREERSRYGVGFRLDVLERLGGEQVRYVERGTRDAADWQARVDARRGAPDPGDPFWREARSVDLYGGGGRDGRWEEEWRVPGGLRFEVDDVAFLLIPEHLHDKARSFFEGARRDNSGPAYMATYIDAAWDAASIERVLREGNRLPPPEPWTPPRSPFARVRRP